jgi:glycerate-2-kinase
MISPEPSSPPAELLFSLGMAALESQMPDLLIQQHLCYQRDSITIGNHSIDLDLFDRIHVLAAGKGALSMYRGLRTLLGEKIDGGVVVSTEQFADGADHISFCKGSHPIPDKWSLAAGQNVLRYIRDNVSRDDLVFFLMSGGASAMMVYPLPGLSLSDITHINNLLLKSGADIREINCVRKHLSAIKGGRLAELIYPAMTITLVISDIVGSPLEDIGSGPTIGDSSTFEQLVRILDKYQLNSHLTPALKNVFENGRNKRVAETPAPDDPKFARNQAFLLGDIASLLDTLKKKAQEKGIACRILSDSDRGDVAEVAGFYGRRMKKLAPADPPGNRPRLLLAGGEVTVKVRGRGKGGRNQQFILHLLRELSDFHKPFCAMSLGSDGIDGPTDAAGAWIDHHTHDKVKEMNLSIEDHLANNDSYNFFAQIDQLVKTGPTGTNVMDLRMFYLPQDQR